MLLLFSNNNDDDKMRLETRWEYGCDGTSPSPHTHNLVDIESSGKLHPSPFSLGSLLKRFDITIYIQRHSSMKWNETKRYEKKRINLLRFELWSVLNCQASVWTCERTCCSNQIESNWMKLKWSEQLFQYECECVLYVSVVQMEREQREK